MTQPPEVSIVIPVYDEEPILHAAVIDLRERLGDCDFSYEVLLAENGSKDGTARVGRELGERYPEIQIFSVGQPNYGLALRRGIARARGELVICEEIDLCDTDFHRRAVAILRRREADLVIGSKLIAGAEDARPLFRHTASQIYNGILRLLLGFRGTDTHGLKAFRKEVVAPIAARCVVDRDVFASELVIRAYREGIAVAEVPVRLLEKRPPTINLIRRVPAVLRSLVKLTRAIGLRGG